MRDTQCVMPRQSLLDYFQPDCRPSNEAALVWRRGYRVVRWSYRDLFQAAAHFSVRLRSQGVKKGERVFLWGENSGEWIAAFLGCLFCGAVAVPMDAIADPGFARRVAEQAGARLAVIGHGLPPMHLPMASIDLDDLGVLVNDPAFRDLSFERAERGHPVEIVFTSGTTAEPRGVVLTHGNLLANLEPIEKEIERYRRYERFVHPLRFLDLLPLSHVFGQLLGIFLPQILGATSVFTDTLNPSSLVGTIHDQRISVLVTVPRLIGSLKEHMERDLAARGQLEGFQRDFKEAEGESLLKRWWRFRRIRGRLGWKFWAIISGGAALSAESEMFWGRLGYAVIQGYGLTETTSLISVNHPFRIGRGSIGKTLPGLDVKLADDGEILVRGENVASGYWKDFTVAPVRSQDGWFHTGDIGERDAEGNLYFKGRSKNVIVTPEGLNVHPEDLEAELRKDPGVRDCVVVGIDRSGNAEPCAVLLLRESSDHENAADIVGRADARLAPFQQMRHWMVWPGPDFPRTPTQKPILGEIKLAVEDRFGHRSVPSSKAAPAAGTLRELFGRVTGKHMQEDASTKLHLSSIERVELLSALEDRYQVDLSETEFVNAETSGAIERLLEQPTAHAPLYHYPRWAQSWPVRAFRAALFHLLARPAMLVLGWPRVTGQENLRGVTGPVIVAANHVAFFDPAYVLESLPARFRCKLAVAMDGETLESLRNPPIERGLLAGLADRAAYWLVVAVYNVFPLPLRAGFRKSFAFAGDLIDRGWNVLIFPEGAITRDGRMGPFRAGIGLLATQLRVPVLPVRLDGIFELKATGRKWAQPGHIKVSIGAPACFASSDRPEDIAGDLERRVAALAPLSQQAG
jgi:long-chain acyl-CoA synthetase